MFQSMGRSCRQLALTFALVFAAGVAQAQITTQSLIGDAVSEVGTKYSEIDQAIQRFTNRDIPGARLLLEAAKRKDPSLPPTDVTMAKLYILSGNGQGGRSSLEKAAMEVPGDPEAYIILADQAVREGQFIEAEALYDKVLPIIDKFSENQKRKRNFQLAARAGRAALYERKRDWASAAGDLQELIKVDPENANAYYRLGRALFMQRKYQQGYDQFKTARQKDKNKVVPLPDVAAALLYDQLSQTVEGTEADEMQKKAQQFFDRALSGPDKNDSTALVAYGQWLIKHGELEKANQVLAEARKSNPEVVNLLVLSGIAARMNGQAKPAEDFFMEALRISPANSDTLNQLALMLVDQADAGKRQRALEFAGISSRLNNESSDAQVTLAWVLFALGRVQEAERALVSGIQIGNLSPDSNYLVAKMLADRNPTAAKQFLQQAVANEQGQIFVNQKDAKTMLDSMGS